MNRLEYYKELRDHLKTTVKELRFVGLYNNQYAKESQEQSIDWPNVLIRMQPSNFRDSGAGLGIQDYDLTVTLFIGYTNFADQGEDVLNLVECVYLAAHRFVPSIKSFGKLMRTEERQDFDHDQGIIHEIDFNVHFVDYSGDNRGTDTKQLTEQITVTIS